MTLHKFIDAEKFPLMKRTRGFVKIQRLASFDENADFDEEETKKLNAALKKCWIGFEFVQIDEETFAVKMVSQKDDSHQWEIEVFDTQDRINEYVSEIVSTFTEF